MHIKQDKIKLQKILLNKNYSDIIQKISNTYFETINKKYWGNIKVEEEKVEEQKNQGAKKARFR